MDIKFITSDEVDEILVMREPLGLFYSKEDKKFIAIDNRTGEAWTEEFDTREECLGFLNEDPVKSARS